MSVNKSILVGNLGADPDLKYTNNGKAVVTLRLATNEVYTDGQGNKKRRTEWHRAVVWGKQAESCAEYLTKGRQVYIEGRLQTRSWKDKDDVQRYTTEIVAQRVQFLGANPSNNTEAQTESADEDQSMFGNESSVDEQVQQQVLSTADAQF